MPVKRCGTVTLMDPGTEWDFPLSCRTASLLLRDLLRHNFRSIKRRALQALGIDMRTRRERENFVYAKDADDANDANNANDADDDDESNKRALDALEMRTINKGLAMELLSACVFTCLDNPIEVKSYCQLSDGGEPKSYASNGKADITVDYEGFALVVEVSARKTMSGDNFRTQINQAIGKAKGAFKEHGKPIYALAINEGSLEGAPVYSDVYAELELIARQEGRIRLIPIWAKDFAQIAATLSDPKRDVGLRFESESLASAFDHVYERITTEDRRRIDRGWMRATILAVLEGKPLPEDEDSDGEDSDGEENGSPEDVDAG